ncbi:MAG: hypothetical protein ABSE42_02910 [Bryobacteraceae bacterium]|jgi:hypothetical protein
MAIDPQTTLRQLRKGLALRPDEIDIKKIAPLFVPASFFAKGNWPGPHVKLRAREVGLTWSLLLPDQTMRYVDFGMQEYWDAQGIDWKAVALRNLAEHSGDKPGTHAIQRAGGEVYAFALMHADGIGPSRLLLRDRLCAFFPGGYQVALPEMSCAFAFSVGLDKKEMATIQNLVDNCFRKGTRPLAPGIYAPDDLLPETEPS